MTHNNVDHTDGDALSAHRPAAAADAGAARRLAAHGRGAGAAGAGRGPLPPFVSHAAEARQRRAAVRRTEPRPVRRLAGPGVRSADDRRRPEPAPTIASAISTCRRKSPWPARRSPRACWPTSTGSCGKRNEQAAGSRWIGTTSGRSTCCDSATGGGAFDLDAGAAGDPRALRPQPARAIGAAGAAAGRAGRAAGDRLLAERRHQERERLLGHAQPQLHRPEGRG